MAHRSVSCVAWGMTMLFFCGQIHAAEVTAHLALPKANAKERTPPAVLWLKPLQGEVPFAAPAKFVLLQKNKMFHPHLLVVPVGSSVSFPNEDPFFHNVFSLFDGRRFDLGLYEAGSTRAVVFPREGVSYIFCNIHPDMSAVVVSLTTPLYAMSDSKGAFHIADVPEGDYEVHLWVEGRRGDTVNQEQHRLHVGASAVDIGTLQAGPQDEAPTHLNKFGKPYESGQDSTY